MLSLSKIMNTTALVALVGLAGVFAVTPASAHYFNNYRGYSHSRDNNNRDSGRGWNHSDRGDRGGRNGGYHSERDNRGWDNHGSNNRHNYRGGY